MTIRRISVLVALVASLSIAACANGDPATSDPGSAGAPAAPAESPAEVPAEPSADVPKDSESVTVSGTVTAGVEPNCLLIKTETGDHLLIFDDPQLKSAARVGAQITVVGRSDPQMMTTCQQGTPLVVASVRGA